MIILKILRLKNMASPISSAATLLPLLLLCCFWTHGLEISLGCWKFSPSDLDTDDYVTAGGVISDTPLSDDCSQLCSDFEFLFAGKFK